MHSTVLRNDQNSSSSSNSRSLPSHVSCYLIDRVVYILYNNKNNHDKHNIGEYYFYIVFKKIIRHTDLQWFRSSLFNKNIVPCFLSFFIPSNHNSYHHRRTSLYIPSHDIIFSLWYSPFLLDVNNFDYLFMDTLSIAGCFVHNKHNESNTYAIPKNLYHSLYNKEYTSKDRLGRVRLAISFPTFHK